MMNFISYYFAAAFLCVFVRSNCVNFHETEEKIYSQNGEDGVLLALLDLIKPKSYSYVEFGVESGVECNTRILREHLNYTGLMMDGGFENSNIGLQKEFITEENILELFSKYSVPKSFDVLSIDTDVFDFWLLVRLLRDGQYRPRILIVETNPTVCVATPNLLYDFNRCNSIPLTIKHPQHLHHDSNATEYYSWDLTRYGGANPKAFASLAFEYGYDMMYCERCGVNCFLVLESELPSNCKRNSEKRGLGAVSSDNMDVYVPSISYPCFGTAFHSGPGHPVDPLKRATVHLSHPLLQKIVAGVAGMRDYNDHLYSCDVGGEAWGNDWCGAVDIAGGVYGTDVIDITELTQPGGKELSCLYSLYRSEDCIVLSRVYANNARRSLASGNIDESLSFINSALFYCGYKSLRDYDYGTSFNTNKRCHHLRSVHSLGQFLMSTRLLLLSPSSVVDLPVGMDGDITSSTNLQLRYSMNGVDRALQFTVCDNLSTLLRSACSEITLTPTDYDICIEVLRQGVVDMVNKNVLIPVVFTFHDDALNAVAETIRDSVIVQSKSVYGKAPDCVMGVMFALLASFSNYCANK